MSVYRSPAKKMRTMKRMLTFLISKLAKKPKPALSICSQDICIQPNLMKSSDLSVSKLESYSYKPKPPFRQHMGFAKAYEMNLPAPLRPPRPTLSSVTLKSTCDTPECQHRHRPCFYTGIPKPWIWRVPWYYGHHTQSTRRHSQFYSVIVSFNNVHHLYC